MTDHLPPDRDGLSIPPDREPPARLRAATLHRAFGSEPAVRRGRLAMPLLAAACVGLLVTGGFVLDRVSDDGTPQPADTTGTATPSPTPEIVEGPTLDRGPMSSSQLRMTLANCSRAAGFTNGGVQVRYSRLVAAADGPQPLVIVESGGGTLYRCGGGFAQEVQTRGIDDPRDIEALRRARTAAGTVVDGRYEDFASSQLFQVGADVDRVGSRLVGPNGELSPWRSMPNIDGFVYAAQWFIGRSVSFAGGEVRVQFRALDVDGSAILDNALQGYPLADAAPPPGQPVATPGTTPGPSTGPGTPTNPATPSPTPTDPPATSEPTDPPATSEQTDTAPTEPTLPPETTPPVTDPSSRPGR